MVAPAHQLEATDRLVHMVALGSIRRAQDDEKGRLGERGDRRLGQSFDLHVGKIVAIAVDRFKIGRNRSTRRVFADQLRRHLNVLQRALNRIGDRHVSLAEDEKHPVLELACLFRHDTPPRPPAIE